jgi:hypothetical protein
MALTFDPATALREFMVVIDGQEVRLGVGPATYTDFLGSFDWAVRQGLVEVAEEEIDGELKQTLRSPGIGGLAIDNYSLVRRIKIWEGIADPQGLPVPCTDINKMAFFAQYPGVLIDLAGQLARAERIEKKNSGTSPVG